VPRLPPAICGVGDYACLLARQLRQAHDIHTRFLVCDPSWKGTGDGTIDGFHVDQIREQTVRDLLGYLSSEALPVTVLLHYVGYSYQKRGCPVWLVEGLKRWRREQSHRRLVTMFHELYASGPIWSSAFWTRCLQRKLTTVVAGFSDCCLTNRMRSADELKRLTSRNAGFVGIFPVFSNFGELIDPLPLPQRPPQAIFFGGIGRSGGTRTQALASIQRACQYLGVAQLISVGCVVESSELAPVTVKNHSILEMAEASRLLSASRVGFLDYYDGYLGKSGIFAAYASHGVAPVLLTPNSSGSDGLLAGRDFLVAGLLNCGVSPHQQQEIAAAAFGWYGSHNLARTAEGFANRMLGPALIC